MITGLVQLAGFLLGAWLLARFVDWCYRLAGPEPLNDRAAGRS